MKKNVLITPVSLQDTYVHPGKYAVKFLLDPRKSQATEINEILIVDADGRPMLSEVRRWGTKVHVTFTIDESTPDGVALVNFVLADGRRERFRFWVIK